MQPNVAVLMRSQRCSGFLCVVKIALHNCRAADADFALRAVRNLGIVFRVNYLIINVRERDAMLPSRKKSNGVRQDAVTHSVVP